MTLGLLGLTRVLCTTQGLLGKAKSPRTGNGPCPSPQGLSRVLSPHPQPPLNVLGSGTAQQLSTLVVGVAGAGPALGPLSRESVWGVTVCL